jgi:ABC-type transport system involved in cytochrome c biogenesis permease subunit
LRSTAFTATILTVPSLALFALMVAWVGLGDRSAIIALTAYACFGWGAWKALRLLWTREERYDLESYTAVHMGTIFGVLTLVSGSIWARTSWGVWWSWGERQLVLFLVLFLFYSAYFMLRYSLDPGPARARISAVYALMSGPSSSQWLCLPLLTKSRIFFRAIVSVAIVTSESP